MTLTDCDICAFLPECEKDPTRQLKKCWRHKSFLEELHRAIDNLQETVEGMEARFNPPATGDDLQQPLSQTEVAAVGAAEAAHRGYLEDAEAVRAAAREENR